LGRLKRILREKNKSIHSTFISSYIPRKCGIASCTKDLTRAINLINPYSKSEIVALIKPEDKIDYPPEVKFKINQYEVDSYIKAAGHINKSKTDIVVLEHEFGLYGGDFGEYIIQLIELLKKPPMVTTHTIPDNYSEGYGLVLKDVFKFAKKVVVMMPESLQKLIKNYNCPKEKIEIIPHGVPDIALEVTAEYKKIKGFEDRIILGNINLLSASKGLEYTIDALKKIKEQIIMFYI
jgi:glycosyltransferase involved in cell wall biosynthesis